MIGKIIEELFEMDSLKVGDFTLKSGQKSSIYIDLRAIISRPELLRNISEAVWQCHTTTPHHLCGVPYTALPMATSITLVHHIPMVMRRKESKEYGTKRKIEGMYVPGDSVIIIEDVLTTGASVLETIEDLKAAGLKVVEVLAFLDREQGGRARLEKAGYPFHAVVTLTEVAKHLYEKGLIDAKLKQAILNCRK